MLSRMAKLETVHATGLPPMHAEVGPHLLGIKLKNKKEPLVDTDFAYTTSKAMKSALALARKSSKSKTDNYGFQVPIHERGIMYKFKMEVPPWGGWKPGTR